MRSICLYFQIHQPYRLRTYRFFDIGSSHHYYDEYQNRTIIKRVVERSYLPMNRLLLDLIKEYGAAFKVSFSISGIAIDQFKQYSPEVIKSFKALADTGNVEFLAETYAHSLVSLKDKEEFKNQVEQHANTIEELFGRKPTSFRNTELIYSDEVGEQVLEMGFDVMLTEGAKHILGWKSPNFMYCNAVNPKLKLLLRNFQLSDDIGFRFSNQSWIEWPLTAEKFAKWINTYKNQQVVNIFLDYETFGEHQWKETGIFEFMKALPKEVLSRTNFKFSTPSELANELQPVSAVSVPTPISWADEERDLTAWLGNEMQDEAYDLLYSLKDKVHHCSDPEIKKDWLYLQTSDHFYYMCTKWFSDGAVHKYFNPYTTPYEAFINYMNILSDFISRVEENYIAPLETEETEQLYDVNGSGMISNHVSSEVEQDFDLIFSLSKKDLKKAIDKIDVKELAYSLYDKAEDKLSELKKKLPAAYKSELDKIIKEIKKPRRATIENYRKKVASKIQSYF
ncbi:MAG: polysaccharide deacetylase family protein [Omnitrophica WOR_2 bacterium]|jgi:alpha-amylase